MQALVDDAVAKGAQLLAGGVLPPQDNGQFYPPTILSGIKPGMRIWTEEVFGPVMSIVSWSADDEVVALANDCPFGLGSSVFARSQARARRIASKLEAGMSSVNDFATTYMCQSLPFGGVKHSGFDRFAGKRKDVTARCVRSLRFNIPAAGTCKCTSALQPGVRVSLIIFLHS